MHFKATCSESSVSVAHQSQRQTSMFTVCGSRLTCFVHNITPGSCPLTQTTWTTVCLTDATKKPCLLQLRINWRTAHPTSVHTVAANSLTYCHFQQNSDAARHSSASPLHTFLVPAAIDSSETGCMILPEENCTEVAAAAYW